MRRIVVMGHGGYAEGTKQNLEMIIGPSEHMYYVDLRKEDDLAGLESRVKQLVEGFNGDEVLFACDLLGASPFRVAAMLSASNPGKYYTVTGLNTAAFLEISMSAQNDVSIEELAKQAVEAARAAVARFPE